MKPFVIYLEREAFEQLKTHIKSPTDDRWYVDERETECTDGKNVYIKTVYKRGFYGSPYVVYDLFTPTQKDETAYEIHFHTLVFKIKG